MPDNVTFLPSLGSGWPALAAVPQHYEQRHQANTSITDVLHGKLLVKQLFSSARAAGNRYKHQAVLTGKRYSPSCSEGGYQGTVTAPACVRAGCRGTVTAPSCPRVGAGEAL